MQILQCNSSSLKKAKQRDFQNLLLKNKRSNDGQVSTTSRPNTPIPLHENAIIDLATKEAAAAAAIAITKKNCIVLKITNKNNKIPIKKSKSETNFNRSYYHVI